MSQQTIDIIAPGDTLPVGGGKINDNFDELYTSPAGATGELQFVSENGSDAADGLTWANAVRTIDQAFTNLPSRGAANAAHKYGTIYMGAGEFETAGDLPLRADIHIIGMGINNYEGQGGTNLMLADGANAHMFDYGAYDDWAHNVLLQDLTLDGNSANNTGSYDLLRLYRGGFNCRLRSVFFKDALRYGLYIGGTAVDLYGYDLSFVDCAGAAIYFSHTSAAPVMAFYGLQIDRCGQYPVYIDSSTSLVSSGHISFYDIEFEAYNAADHDACIYFSSAHTGALRTYISVCHCYAYHSVGGENAVIYEASNNQAASWYIRNVRGSGYTYAFDSAETGETNLSNAQGHTNVTDEFQSGDRVVQHGDVAFYTGAGTPESNVAAPPGSIYLNSSGGSDTTLYVKESGTGDTGWSALAGV